MAFCDVKTKRKIGSKENISFIHYDLKKSLFLQLNLIDVLRFLKKEKKQVKAISLPVK
jgi:hypothetical protein